MPLAERLRLCLHLCERMCVYVLVCVCVGLAFRGIQMLRITHARARMHNKAWLADSLAEKKLFVKAGSSPIPRYDHQHRHNSPTLAPTQTAKHYAFWKGLPVNKRPHVMNEPIST